MITTLAHDGHPLPNPNPDPTQNRLIEPVPDCRVKKNDLAVDHLDPLLLAHAAAGAGELVHAQAAAHLQHVVVTRGTKCDWTIEARSPGIFLMIDIPNSNLGGKRGISKARIPSSP